MHPISIAGNLTQAPELRFTQSGIPVTSFGIADNESWTDANGNEQSRTTFFDVVAWKHLAERVALLPKGQRVMVTGRLRKRSYENKQGQTVWVTELHATDIGASILWNEVTSGFVPKNQQVDEDPTEGLPLPEQDF